MTQPRPAASLLLVTPTNRLLLVHRPAHGTFPGAHVFPGGTISPSDPSAAFTAVRETFEETGLLLSPSPPDVNDLVLAQLQRAVHDGTADLAAWARARGITLLGESDMVRWSEWTTPPALKKRFKTQFFVARLPSWIDESLALAGDGGREVVSASFWPIDDVLAAAKEKKMTLYSPQLYLIHKLRATLDRGGWDAVKRLSEGGFGTSTHMPLMRDEGGKKVIRVGRDALVFVGGGDGPERGECTFVEGYEGAKL